MRRAAETPWFQSYLAFDPARVMRDVRQPVLIVQGALDTQVPPHHAEKLAELARARKRKVAVDVADDARRQSPARAGHRPARSTSTRVLPDKQVSPAATAAIAAGSRRSWPNALK